MLSKPIDGWTNVTIGGFSDRASYITDVPIKCLKAFIFSFETSLPATINFDAEGWEYTIVSDCCTTHVICKNNEYENSFSYLTIGVGRNILAKEIIKDIEENIDEWTIWTGFGKKNNSIKEKRKKELIDLIGDLKRLLLL